MSPETTLIPPLPVIPRWPDETPAIYKRQADVLRAIAEWRLLHAYPPSIREIARIVGDTSPTSVYKALYRLRAKGVVDWVDGYHSTITILYSSTQQQNKEQTP